jgi:hypothetical protein
MFSFAFLVKILFEEAEDNINEENELTEEQDP